MPLPLGFGIKGRTGVFGRIIKIHIFFSKHLSFILFFKINSDCNTKSLSLTTKIHLFARLTLLLFLQISLILFTKRKVSTSINIYSTNTILHVHGRADDIGTMHKFVRSINYSQGIRTVRCVKFIRFHAFCFISILCEHFILCTLVLHIFMCFFASVCHRD